MTGARPEILSDGPDARAAAAACLRSGGLVAFPTETVYGLGADATNGNAVARIFEAKERPSFNPLIVHVLDRAEAAHLGEMNTRADRLAARFWPGPLTFVLRQRPASGLCDLVGAGLDTIAVRCPAHETARALLAAAKLPIAAPSANRSGRLSPTTAAHVAADLGDRVDIILDGGPCPVGLESTIVDLSTDRACLLRPGGLPAEVIEGEIGPLATPGQGVVKAPGMIPRHYAPRLPLRLDATVVESDEALLAFGASAPTGALLTRNLSPDANLVEAAASLFTLLHELENCGARTIAVMPIPEEGLGRAINDRLRRGATA